MFILKNQYHQVIMNLKVYFCHLCHFYYTFILLKHKEELQQSVSLFLFSKFVHTKTKIIIFGMIYILHRPKSVLFCNIDSNKIYQWWNFAAIIDFKWKHY